MVRQARRNQLGFTLIEAMIAMAVLLVASLAMLSVVPFGFNSVETDSVHVQAVAVAQQYLDDERNALLHNIAMPSATTAPIDAGDSYVTRGQADGGSATFAIAPDGCTTVADTGTSADAYSCSVSVSWTQAGAGRSVTVQSYVTK